MPAPQCCMMNLLVSAGVLSIALAPTAGCTFGDGSRSAHARTALMVETNLAAVCDMGQGMHAFGRPSPLHHGLTIAETNPLLTPIVGHYPSHGTQIAVTAAAIVLTTSIWSSEKVPNWLKSVFLVTTSVVETYNVATNFGGPCGLSSSVDPMVTTDPVRLH